MLTDIALLGGALLSVASDQATAPGAGKIRHGIFPGTVMAHFVVDAGRWRMREEFPRAVLPARLPCLLPAAGTAR